MSSLSFEPLVSAAAWVTLAIASSAVLAWYVWRRPAACPQRRWFVSSLLMVAALAAVLVVLLNPTWLEPIPPPAGKPLLTVLVDSSLSMATNDLEGERSRYGAAAEIAAEVAEDLEGRYEVRVRTFGAVPTASAADELLEKAPEATVSDLATAVSESLEDDSPQGQAMLLLSDGAHNATGGTTRLLETATTARSMAAPVFTHTFGGDVRLNDLELSVPRAQELAFAGQPIPIRVRVRQRGVVSDRTELILEADGEEIERQEVPLSRDGTSDVLFHVKSDDGGLYQYTVRMEEHAAETTSANNTAFFQVRVVQDPIRVLVLEGKPYWDGKFLMRTLAADAALELDFVVQLAEGRFMRRSLRLTGGRGVESNLPENEGETEAEGGVSLVREQTTEILGRPDLVFAGEDRLSGYQVLVLGRDAEAFLSDAAVEEIRNWVSSDGGSLVCFRGSPVANPDQQLSRLLPVRWAPGRAGRFRMQVTDRGESLDWLAPAAGSAADLQKLPSLSTTSIPESVKPLAVVLGQGESGEDAPVLTYQPYGTGRVVAVEGAGMWRWAFLAPEYQQHDPVYGSLWQSLMRWLVSSVGLAPGQDVAFRIDQVSYNVGEPVSAVVLRRPAADEGDPPKVVLTQPDGAEQRLTPVPFGDEPGVYQVYFGRLEAGRYDAVLDSGDGDAAESAIAFQVRPYLGEQLDVDARPDLMRRIAEQSGGAALDEVSPAAVAKDFSEHLTRTRPERVRRIRAWDRWWVLLGVVALWASAWTIRRASGLV